MKKQSISSGNSMQTIFQQTNLQSVN